MNISDLTSDISTESLKATTKLLENVVELVKDGKISVEDIKTETESEELIKILDLCKQVYYPRKGKRGRKQDDQEPKKRRIYIIKCYICKNKINDCNDVENARRSVEMCDDCRNLNTIKRSIKADLRGKVAIVTGARVKIGWETVIRLLECGCKVIITTRFPADAEDRYRAHPKYEEFKHLLTIYGVDLRYLKDIHKFVNFVHDNFDRLDILIHNAAQTLRRPREFFKHLIQKEIDNTKLKITNDTKMLCINDKSSNEVNCTSTIICQQSQNDILTVSDCNGAHLMVKVLEPLTNESSIFFPEGQYDKNNEQIDLRQYNTWISTLGDIDVSECAELMSINVFAPFVMNQCFKDLMNKSCGSYIVNVSSMEGVFYYDNKTSNHPQTNMAKAALNMMTRTSAYEYAKQYKIYMVSVDTGWVTNEYPTGLSTVIEPLDNLDGACRVLDPVLNYFNGGSPVYGVFLKDYMKSDW